MKAAAVAALLVALINIAACAPALAQSQGDASKMRRLAFSTSDQVEVSGTSVPLVAIIAGTAVVVVVALIVICCCCCRRRKAAQSVKPPGSRIAVVGAGVSAAFGNSVGIADRGDSDAALVKLEAGEGGAPADAVLAKLEAGEGGAPADAVLAKLEAGEGGAPADAVLAKLEAGDGDAAADAALGKGVTEKYMPTPKVVYWSAAIKRARVGKNGSAAVTVTSLSRDAKTTNIQDWLENVLAPRYEKSWTGCICYNDQPPDGSNPSNVGHCKGVVLWNENLVGWLIHSFPRWPKSAAFKRNNATGIISSVDVNVTFDEHKTGEGDVEQAVREESALAMNGTVADQQLHMGQSAVWLALPGSQLDGVLQQLGTMGANVYYNITASGGKQKIPSPFGKFVNFYTLDLGVDIDGNKLVHVAKRHIKLDKGRGRAMTEEEMLVASSEMEARDIYSGYLAASHFGRMVKWTVHTWSNNKSGEIYKREDTRGFIVDTLAIYNVGYVSYEFPYGRKDEDGKLKEKKIKEMRTAEGTITPARTEYYIGKERIEVSPGRHHGKWAYTESGPCHAFIGDLNRCNQMQWSRGGGGVVIASEALHRFLESHTVATRAQPAVASFAVSSASSGVGAASLEAAASSMLSEQ